MRADIMLSVEGLNRLRAGGRKPLPLFLAWVGHVISSHLLLPLHGDLITGLPESQALNLD